MNKQPSISFGKTFLKLQGGFQKGFSIQNCLLVIFEKWKHVVETVKTLQLHY